MQYFCIQAAISQTLSKYSYQLLYVPCTSAESNFLFLVGVVDWLTSSFSDEDSEASKEFDKNKDNLEVN